jgi:NitT/TauT family transport system permease protein
MGTSSTKKAPAAVRRSADWHYAAAAVFASVVAWQIVTDVFNIPGYLVPSPLAVAKEIAANWKMLIVQSGVTSLEIIAGFALSIVVGLALAVLIAFSNVFEKASYPLIIGSNTVPKVALAPILFAWFGFGLLPKILLVMLVAFLPIVISGVTGFKSLPLQMTYLAQSMGARKIQQVWHFHLPYALPSIFSGIKIASSVAVVGAVVAEFAGADGGLGYTMMMAASDINIARQFAAIFLLSIIGITLFWLVEYIERLFIPGHRTVRDI